MLPLVDILEDQTVQLRGGLDLQRVEAMVEYEAEGGRLPPILTVGNEHLLADGHHRIAAARRSGRTDIEVDNRPGGKAEAIALAIQGNDTKLSVPLTRTQRNEGVKLLLLEGWSQEKVASTVGVNHTTIGDIHNSLAMRGLTAKAVGGKGSPKAVAVLPTEVHKHLNDTTLVRIATLPKEQQADFAAAVARVGLSEPRVREAIKALKDAPERPPESVVADYTPSSLPKKAPLTLPDKAKLLIRALSDFKGKTFGIDGRSVTLNDLAVELMDLADIMPFESQAIRHELATLEVWAGRMAPRFAPLIEGESTETRVIA